MQFQVSLFPWWFYLTIGVLIALPLIQRLVQEVIQEHRFARAGLSDVRRMSWRDFEKYLDHLFRSLGYQTELTPPSGDYGLKELGDAMELARRGGTADAQVAASARAPVFRQPASPVPPKSGGTASRADFPKPLGLPVKRSAGTGPACPECGSPMVARMAGGRPIWLCSRFPGCKGARTKN